MLSDLQTIDRLGFCQQKALDELRKESEELYQEAIQVSVSDFIQLMPENGWLFQFDFHLIPFTSVGPVETPVIENYNVPDGEYQDVSKKWT